MPDLNLLTRIDAVTGRMTMYRLVLTGLGGLAALSLLASVLGLLAYQPQAIALSLAVPLLTSFLSNRAIAAVYRVTPHSESSLITGYLIFFIFPPTTGLLPLLGLALAAMFASGSKYLLAVRGRHIFNPAAAGAFTLTLCGVYYSGWWIGNPILLPFTVLFSFLILRRTQRLAMGAVFVGVSGGIMIIRSLMAGIDIGTSLWWPFASSPMIFFAGFMLSEPLTQPPLRWQQLTMATLVGSLFSIPMHVGSVYIAPESALLIGNLLGFAFGQRKGIRLVLRQKTTLTPTTIEFAFTPTRRLSFQPGQYLELTLPHKNADARGLRRVFSISSPPSRTGSVAIGTKIPPDASTFKQALVELPEGAVVTATTIAGDFVLPRDATSPLLLIAGGIGITPFASQLADQSAAAERDVVVIYSVSSSAEISYRDVLEASNARVVLVASAPIEDLPAGWTWVEGTRVDEKVLADHVPDITQRHVYVSGPPTMVAGVGAAARRLEAAGVRTDYFSGY